MGDTEEFYYEPDEEETLSTAVVTAVARAHDEDMIDQKWLISEDINADALDGLFQQHNLKMTLQFEADTTTATIMADVDGNPVIRIESHR
ncbi:HalOD1 output domain-containing protein [Haloglomus halophilum]|uniref:HalOD1 output domain-containing protein n=1 Tax=Haloglomus halophilum TaxID=2962672 RepID=UPI0020CA2043|nr:HalOD1 output domain-containing protein [Haloglomus halophilum]